MELDNRVVCPRCKNLTGELHMFQHTDGIQYCCSCIRVLDGRAKIDSEERKNVRKI